MIRVLFVDDDMLSIAVWCKYLSSEPDIEIVGTAKNGHVALDAVATTQPDVVVMDIKMPVMNGVRATRALQTLHPACKILLLTTWDDDRYVWEGILAGAHGYKYKHSEPHEVAAAIRAVVRGDSTLDSVAVEKMKKFMRQYPMPSGVPADDSSLSKRERMVLELLAADLRNHEIAKHLDITELTVKSHVNHILGKLEVASRGEAVREARLRGLL